MARLLLLIQVSRPILWPVLPLVYALGLHAARAPLSAAAIVQMLLLTFPMNLVGCGLNDIYDYESDCRSTRRRAIWGAVVGADGRPFIWHALLAMLPLIVLGACLTRNWDNIVSAVGLVIIAWLYSAPPLRLKERPLLDSLANGLGYFLLPLMMGYSLGADVREMPRRYYLLALCVAGIHALATAADYDADKAAGHRTFAVAFGRRTAAAFACMTFVLAAMVGDYGSLAVWVFLFVASLAAFMVVLLPWYRMIVAACAVIFLAFFAAAAFHLAGW